MNAKKIMGAVLVAFLAAALFIGAGAAAAEGTDYGTVFIYQANTTLPAGVWTLVGGTATVTTVDNDSSTAVVEGTNVMPGANFVAGTYKLGDDTVDFVKPTASYALTAEINGIYYIVENGGKVYNASNLTFSIESLNKNVSISNWYITYPSGGEVDSAATNANMNSTKGTIKVQAIFDKADFVKGIPDGINVDENSFTYTVVGADDATISASVDTAFSGEAVTFTVEGTPGKSYKIEFVGFAEVSANQLQTAGLPSGAITADNITFTIGNSGKFTFDAVVDSDEADPEDKTKATAKLVDVKNGEIKIKISAPVVTAKVDATSYFIGDNIKISGTSSAETTYTFNITGINFKSTELDLAEVDDNSEFKKDWYAILSTKDVKELDVGKKLDVGTYTIEIKKGSDIVKTVTVVLKQPFISIIEAPEVIVQGTDAEFIINAEATDAIRAYIFGTNYFLNVTDIEAEDEDVPNQFTVTLDKAKTNKTLMATGQYFMVFQHPMYDGAFNVTYDEATKFFKEGGVNLFNVENRQTANAAQALCDALDSQNFDDMYVKYSFFVAGEDESFSISEIPTSVAQGETITISGVDTANAGETVTVQMLSTAFAAVPKETVGSAAFILVTTEVAEDGTWEVTLDTSDLNVDEYSLSVAIDNVPKKTVTVNVVEADEPVTPEQPEEPEQPEQPEEPVAPATPGFGALAALAGLGAVAVLLLRRE